MTGKAPVFYRYPLLPSQRFHSGNDSLSLQNYEFILLQRLLPLANMQALDLTFGKQKQQNKKKKPPGPFLSRASPFFTSLKSQMSQKSCPYPSAQLPFYLQLTSVGFSLCSPVK